MCRLALPLLLALAAPPAAAQLVTPKTVPVHQADQFAIFPSDRVGMAGVGVAVDDTLADPFATNPARATRLRRAALFATPYFHGVSDGRGGGRTLPIGAGGTFGQWGATGVVALQQLERARAAVWNLPTSERTATNRYVAGALARRFGSGLSVGAGALLAGLGAMDGVDLLYAGSDRIRQDGRVTDVRVGATKEWAGGRVLDVVALHNRTAMTHDVHFTTWRWDSVARRGVSTERDEHNLDRTNVWGAHSQYVQPVGDRGWRLGALATVNRLSHPKIPNYVVMNIPRDPGTTYGVNLGVAAARVVGQAAVGVDLTYEPMSSETWADAARDTAKVGGGIIPAGGRTVENRFRFHNMRLRLGAGRDFTLDREQQQALGFQVGLGAYAIDYRLRQWNRVQGTERTQKESWVEWTPTLALRFRARELDVRYAYRATCGNGSSCLPSITRTDDVSVVQPGVGGGGIIAAPSAPLFFDGGRASAHTFTIVVPLR
ncbi:hypothetical protein [Roseisolibacter agri]|uniref:Outer membrane protein transport protein (OMPP1/FadL/TodX) n=1 Tax=Roseisolibacter agri TaxID=2014610 RepID=A0AA37Q3T8_9BACT|nr:hypothetical protein [Roseisolibacter agri]GLC24112.1 hypothetical protein rosag_06250 [Roseisolibacter agri]